MSRLRKNTLNPVPAAMIVALLLGCTDGLWTPPGVPPTPSPAREGSTLTRIEDDFEAGIGDWAGVPPEQGGWTIQPRTDRPEGDERVLTNTEAGSHPRVAVWNAARTASNAGAGFEVLARNDRATWMGIVLNYQASGDHYLFRVQPEASLWEVQRVGPGGADVLAFGVARDQGNLIQSREYIRLSLGWDRFRPGQLVAAMASPTTGFHTLASIPVASPLVGGRPGVYCISDGVVFDRARVTGVLPVQNRPGIRVRVDRPTQGRFSREVYGANFIWRGDINGVLNTIYDELVYESEISQWFQLLPVVHAAGVSSTRYPGGLETSFYYWKNGVGPPGSRCNPGNLVAQDTISIGTDEFLQFTQELGAEAVITMNPVHFSQPWAGPVTTRYAADWVEYCNAPNDGSNPGGGIDYAALRAFHGHEAPYGVKYWEIGNEIGGGTTAELGQLVRSMARAARAVDPTVELGFQDHMHTPPYAQSPFSPAAREYYTNPQGTGILDLAGNDFDFFTPHPYGPALVEIGPTFSVNGASISITHTFLRPGLYEFSLRGYGTRPTDEPIQGYRYGTLLVRANENTVWKFEVASRSERSWSQEVVIPEAGTYTITLVGDNLIQGREVILTNTFTVRDVQTGETVKVDLTNSEELYGIMQATAPTVEHVFFGQFQDFYGDKPIYPTEWNTTMGFYDAPNDLKWALSNAGYMNVFLDNRTHLSSFWDLSSPRLLVGLIEGVPERTPDPRLRPTAHVMRLYERLMNGERLQVDTGDIPFYSQGIDGLSLGAVGRIVNLRVPYLSTVASLSPSRETLSLIVINRHRTLPLDADVSLEGFTASRDAEVSSIHANTISASNERDDCPPPGDCVRTVTTGWPGASSSFTYRFPAHSVTAFTFFAPGASTQPPALPVDLSAEAEGRTVTLAWAPGPGARGTGYNIYRSRWPEGPFGNRINQGPVTATRFEDTGLDPGVSFTYAVKALGSDGRESDFSGRASVRIPGNLPTTIFPTSVNVITGTPDGTPFALRSADYWARQPLDGGAFYRIRSELGTTEWTLGFEIPGGNRESVSQLAVYFQALYTRGGTQEFHLWNDRTKQWDLVRRTTVHADQIERYMEAFPDSAFVRDHITDEGIVYLKIAAPLGGSFTAYADYCTIAFR